VFNYQTQNGRDDFFFELKDGMTFWHPKWYGIRLLVLVTSHTIGMPEQVDGIKLAISRHRFGSLLTHAVPSLSLVPLYSDFKLLFSLIFNYI
jgi:hypothetical protein